ncbi:MAG: hypothetical protein AAGA66_09310 [Bacteroidota bacterium]
MDIVYAQPPASYYDSTVGKSGYALKTALFQIIKDPKVKSDKQLWTSFKLTDMKGDTIWDMYSLTPLQGKVPSRAVRYLPAPSQIRTSGFPAYGSSQIGFAF